MARDPAHPRPGFSRRIFLGSSGAVAAGAGLAGGAQAQAQQDPAVAPEALSKVTFTLNGKRRTLAVEPRTTLVEALRDTLGMTGTKIGCNHGQCGACTVLMDGRRVNSCLILALTTEGAEIVTVEGLADPGGTLHPMQAAFAEKDAFQCGYCTPGQILSAIGCIEEGHAGSAAEIREYMSGNLCRCGAYPNIVAAIEAVRDEQEG
ncbi:(2Fe-2S)-binding protein [Marinimicrococcus flavescens]|uniref:(2Fe-2S)-binding protein n=1 Tax=Marinimicrococcus flavescens TaxID=3031815 RepID=A0AAP3XSV7_9PROT|nr:(2Fe-2S)-binding protein [Marinimicrococcus flavescens]